MTSPMSGLSNGGYLEKEPQPMSYVLFEIPHKHLKKSLRWYRTPSEVTHDNIFARTTKHSLSSGTTIRDVLNILENENMQRAGLIKARIIMSNGEIKTLARQDPYNPYSFTIVDIYNPNGIFLDTTQEESTAYHNSLKSNLRSLVDANGHGLVPRHKSSFSSEKLFKTCPIPRNPPAGFDFTPVSHLSFLLKPKEPILGSRPLQSGPMKNPCDYRPTSFLREKIRPREGKSTHTFCAEKQNFGTHTVDLSLQSDVIDQRNRLIRRGTTSLNTPKSHSLITPLQFPPPILKNLQKRHHVGSTLPVPCPVFSSCCSDGKLCPVCARPPAFSKRCPEEESRTKNLSKRSCPICPGCPHDGKKMACHHTNSEQFNSTV